MLISLLNVLDKEHNVLCKKLGLVDMFAGSSNGANGGKQAKIKDIVQVEDLSTWGGMLKDICLISQGTYYDKSDKSSCAN